MIQLVVTEEDSEETIQDNLASLPILPLKQNVLFPGLIIPLTLRRPQLIQLVKKAHEADKPLGAVAQKKAQTEEPKAKDLYQVGTIARVLKVIVFPDGNITAILQGKQRFKIEQIIAETPHLLAQVHTLQDKTLKTKKEKPKRSCTRSERWPTRLSA